MKKIFFYSTIFLGLNFLLSSDINITQKAINDSNEIFELQKQANALEKEKLEICDKIFKITRERRKDIKDEDMKKYEDEYIKQTNKNIKNLYEFGVYDESTIFDEIGICLKVKPKMYIKNNGPFDGVPYKKPMLREIKVCTDDNKSDCQKDEPKKPQNGE